MGKLIDQAKKFLQSKSSKAQAFHDRELELRTKLTQLEAKKSKIYNDYDPTKPFDSKKIDAIDKQIEEINKELAVLKVSKQSISDYDPAELIKHIKDVKTEATEAISAKKKEEENARQAILDAKKALLKAQAAHYRVIRKISEYNAELNDVMQELKKPVAQEIEKLREEYRQVEREIYEQAGDGTTPQSAKLSNQHVIDRLYERKKEISQKLSELQAQIADIKADIRPLSHYRDENNKPIYFVSMSEQRNAAEKGEF